MKVLLSIFFLFVSVNTFSQNNEIIKLAFSDKSNFNITTSLDNKKPSVYYVLNKTGKWDTYRFHLDEDLTSEAVRKRLESDEHSYYNNVYIFRDTLLDHLFDSSEKQHLYQEAQFIKPRQLTDTFNTFKLISSFNTAKNGFFFSVTDPIFTRDKQYAFIDIVVFRKDKETEKLNDAYFGTILLVYQHIKGKGWTRIKKLGHLIL